MTTTAIPHHHRVVGATTGASLTTRSAWSSQIEQEGHHLSNGERYFFEEQRTYLAYPQRRAEHPPQLLRTKIIPLPALAVNPFLAYNASKVTLEYDLRLPPIVAHLPPTTKAHANHRDRRQQPAMNPSMVGSMAIIVPGLERVVVVFLATLDSEVVTVDDVLVAVYHAVQESAIEHHGEFGAKRAIQGRRTFVAWGQADLKDNTYIPVVEELGADHWWAGLYPY